MKLGNSPNLRPEDFPGEGEGFYKLLTILNERLDDLASLSQRNITLGDNLAAEVRALPVFHNREFTLKLQSLKRKPTAWFAVAPILFEAPVMACNPLSASELRIKITFASAPTAEQQVTLIFLA